VGKKENLGAGTRFFENCLTGHGFHSAWCRRHGFGCGTLSRGLKNQGAGFRPKILPNWSGSFTSAGSWRILDQTPGVGVNTRQNSGLRRTSRRLARVFLGPALVGLYILRRTCQDRFTIGRPQLCCSASKGSGCRHENRRHVDEQHRLWWLARDEVFSWRTTGWPDRPGAASVTAWAKQPDYAKGRGPMPGRSTGQAPPLSDTVLGGPFTGLPVRTSQGGQMAGRSGRRMGVRRFDAELGISFGLGIMDLFVRSRPRSSSTRGGARRHWQLVVLYTIRPPAPAISSTFVARGPATS